MISINNITVAFGGSAIFENVSFLINAKDRIGLAGKNGAGKSTMLKILAMEQNPTKGDIAKPNDCKIGYLPQDMRHQAGRTVLEETATAFIEIQNLEKRLDEINKELEVRTDYESDSYTNIITELTDIHARLDMVGAGNREQEMEKVLRGLGFDRKEFDRQTSEFSGGWRMRIELGKLLLQKPDVLLLDEPTNHLDIEAIQWLEDYMDVFPGAVILISHDKHFLDSVTTRTIEIVNKKIYDYKANYSKYLQLRAERMESQENAAKNQQKIIDQYETLIDKNRAKASKASFAQSLIKKLDKMERIEVDDVETGAIRFKFPPPAHSGKIILTVEHAGKDYDGKRIFSDANFIIAKGEKIGLVGRNGEGKSTMMKMIGGKIKFDGTVQLGHNVMPGYFEQDQEEKLDTNKTVFETIDDLAVGDVRKQVRGLLGSFLFSNDDIDKKVKVLSGGERGRLALCKLLLQPYNLLMLDEPTNHLDIRSKEVLKKALMDYEGTMIIVSHDRDFLKGMCDKLYEFREGHVKEHLCDITEFMELRKLERMDELKSAVQVVEEKKVKPVVVNNDEQNEKEKNQKLIKSRISKAEKDIEDLEKQIADMDAKLSTPEGYDKASKEPGFFDKYDLLKKKLDTQMQEWEKACEDLKVIS
ncbi:MAG: ABC-F family ATP-binding cassette domain-containing protein [Bacteroidota bacterium]|nr:ABC-F family ATP-binding cassette domain-containing protein [Bacteroidota bacterium]